MEINKAQAVIEELEAVCQKHGVALIGRHVSDGSHGEIQIIETDDLTHDEVEHLSSGDRPYKHDDFTLVNGIT